MLRLMTLKQRPAEKGLILIAAEVGQLEPFIEFPSRQVFDRVMKTWPGPVTWVLPARTNVPKWLEGERGTLAVRVTAHPIASGLCRQAGVLVSTSANPSGSPPARTVRRVRAYFGPGVNYIVPGYIGTLGRPTEIRDGLTGAVLRPGAGGSGERIQY